MPMTDEDYAFLKKLPLFRRLTAEELSTLSSTMRLRRVKPGELLFEQGEAGDDAFVVRTGKLAVELPLPDEVVRTVAKLGEGTVVGEACLVMPSPRSLRVRAILDSSLYVIDGARFASLRAANDPAAYKVIRNIALTLCDRLRDTNVRIQEHWQGRERAEVERTARGVEVAPRTAWGRLRRLFGRAG